MATLENIITLLDKWPLWKRMNEAPGRVDELEKRVAALEKVLERAPGEGCPYCGAIAMRLDRTRGATAWWKCGECEQEVERPSDIADLRAKQDRASSRGRKPFGY